MSKEEYLDQLLASITDGEPTIQDAVEIPSVESVKQIDQIEEEEHKILEPESKLLNDGWDALNNEIRMTNEQEIEKMKDYEIPEQGVLDIEDDIDYDRIQQLLEEEEELEELLKNDDFSLEAFVQDIINSPDENEYTEPMNSMPEEVESSPSEDALEEQIGEEFLREEPIVQEAYLEEPIDSRSLEDEEMEEFDLSSMLEESSLMDSVKDVSDIIEQSLSAVSSMEDELLEQQVNEIQESMSEQKPAMSWKERILSLFKKKEKQPIAEPIEADNSKEEVQIKETKKPQKAKKEKDPIKQAELKKKKQEKALKKAEKKKEKLAKKMEQQAIDAANYVPMNKKAAALVFVVVAILGVLVYGSSTKFTYQLHVSNAKKYFEHTEYTKAYTTLLGMELKESDQILMDRVEIIMRVNKQITSHERNLALGRDIEALDALLKGLQRYQVNYDKAATLSVSMNLDSLKQSILSTLNEVYHISEDTANELLHIENQQEYTTKISQYITK